MSSSVRSLTGSLKLSVNTTSPPAMVATAGSSSLIASVGATVSSRKSAPLFAAAVLPLASVATALRRTGPWPSAATSTASSVIACQPPVPVPVRTRLPRVPASVSVQAAPSSARSSATPAGAVASALPISPPAEVGRSATAGGSVSTRKGRLALAAPGLPAASVWLTSRVWGPCPNAARSCGVSV